MNPQDPSSARGPGDCLLTLAVPRALEEALLDVLEDCVELRGGYSVIPAQGLGACAALYSAMEQVQGRARRVLVQTVLARTELDALLARLRARLPSTEVSYWVVPLLAQGRLA